MKRRRGRPTGKTPPHTQIALRVPDDLLLRVEDYLVVIRGTVPGVKMTRADAIRSLVMLGLEAAGT